MTTFLQSTTTFLQVSYPTWFRSAFFTLPYKHSFGLYERAYRPPRNRARPYPTRPPPPGPLPHPATRPDPAQTGPPLRHPTQPAAPHHPARHRALPPGQHPKYLQRAASQPRSPRVEWRSGAWLARRCKELGFAACACVFGGAQYLQTSTSFSKPLAIFYNNSPPLFSIPPTNFVQPPPPPLVAVEVLI